MPERSPKKRLKGRGVVKSVGQVSIHARWYQQKSPRYGNLGYGKKEVSNLAKVGLSLRKVCINLRPNFPSNYRNTHKPKRQRNSGATEIEPVLRGEHFKLWVDHTFLILHDRYCDLHRISIFVHPDDLIRDPTRDYDHFVTQCERSRNSLTRIGELEVIIR